MVDGRIVFEGGRVTTVDEQALLAEARENFARQRSRRSRRRRARPTAGSRPTGRWSSAARTADVGMNRVDRADERPDAVPTAATRTRRSRPGRAARWPGGEKLAVYVALGVEEYRFGDGLTEDMLPGVPQPDLVNTSWRDYGNRVGAFRLLDRLAALGIPPTVLLNTDVYDTPRR